MSKISTVYDYLDDKMEALFPNHKQLINAIDLEQNPENFLSKGWGIAYLEGSTQDRQIACKYDQSRTIVFTLSRKIFAKDLDLTISKTTEKALLEDFHTLRVAMEQDVQLGNNVVNFKYVSDTGRQSVFTERDQFIYINSSYSLEYFESIL